jgi:sec-independent protein translocase protein TatB
MFGLGWGEMVVIGIVALIAIGPKELPTVLRSLGQWIGKIRRMANEFQGQFQEALREAELTDLKKHAEDISASVTNFDPLADTQKEMEKAFEMPDPMASPPSSGEVPATSGGALPDGAKLPAGAIPSPELPPIDVPLPELPPPVTEKDFAPQISAQQEPQAPEQAEPPKQAGGKS